MAQEPSKIQSTTSTTANNEKSTIPTLSETAQSAPKGAENNKKNIQEKDDKKSNDDKALNSIIIRHISFVSKKPIDLGAIVKPLSDSWYTGESGGATVTLL